MLEVDSAAEVSPCNLIHVSEVRFSRSRQVPANLRAEAEEVVASVGIPGHTRTLANHKPNESIAGVVGIGWHF